MKLMGDKERAYVRDRLSDLPRGVRVLVFTRTDGCPGCEATEQLVREIAEVQPLVALTVLDEGEPERAAAYAIDQRPATVVTALDAAPSEGGVRFLGFPGGYEFDSLLEAIGRVARSEPGLSEPMRAHLAEVTEPLHLRVFVTKTCPYCPRMVQLAHRMAIASPLVRADMVDAEEFPALSARYGVQGVPLTVAGDGVSIVGAVPESRLLDALRRRPTAAPR